LIRSSLVLDEDGKREWLRVLPHLKPADRERLRLILAETPDTAGVGAPSSTP
jgi:hypothetical protein